MMVFWALLMKSNQDRFYKNEITGHKTRLDDVFYNISQIIYFNIKNGHIGQIIASNNKREQCTAWCKF